MVSPDNEKLGLDNEQLSLADPRPLSLSEQHLKTISSAISRRFPHHHHAPFPWPFLTEFPTEFLTEFPIAFLTAIDNSGTPNGF